MPSGEVTNTASLRLLSTVFEIVLGDGGFVQFLPHALERELQIAEFVVAHHGERPGVVALADAVGALHQRGDGPRQLPRDEPGADQSQKQQRQRDARPARRACA